MTWLVPNSISLSKMIMKRVIILFLALLATFASAQAQTKYENFTLGENQYLLGNSFDDKNYYTASSGNKGDVTMATRIAPENYKALKNCRAVGIRRVRVVDPYNLAECDAAVREELAADEPSVIISRRPCALLKYVKHPGPIAVDPTKCVGCKLCMKVGCPAISVENGRAKIDATLCTGCGVCAQLCKCSAIGKGRN